MFFPDKIPIPDLNFKLPSDLPLAFKIEDNTPTLVIEWEFKLAFGFDEDDGFFLYTFPEGKEIQFIGMFELFVFGSVLMLCLCEYATPNPEQMNYQSFLSRQMP